RKQGDVDAKLAETLLHPVVRNRVARVIDAHAAEVEDVAEEPVETAGSLQPEAIAVPQVIAVRGRDGVDREPVQLERPIRLDTGDALGRDPELGDALDERLGD